MQQARQQVEQQVEHVSCNKMQQVEQQVEQQVMQQVEHVSCNKYTCSK